MRKPCRLCGSILLDAYVEFRPGDLERLLSEPPIEANLVADGGRGIRCTLCGTRYVETPAPGYESGWNAHTVSARDAVISAAADTWNAYEASSTVASVWFIDKVSKLGEAIKALAATELPKPRYWAQGPWVLGGDDGWKPLDCRTRALARTIADALNAAGV